MKKQPKKALKSFYKENEHFVCRFCCAPIGEWKKGKLERNKEFTQARATLDMPGIVYQFNGCKGCVKEDMDLELIQEAFDLDPSTPKKGYAKVLEVKLVDLSKELR